MKTIDVLIEDHDNISLMLRVMRKLSYNFMEDLDYDFNDFYKVIEFLRDYSDKYHHKKEEDILFAKLEEFSDEMRGSGTIIGMYIEHDNGRLYYNNLIEAIDKYQAGNKYSKLDIISNCISYTDLLNRHMFKENAGLYIFAEDILNQDVKDFLDLSIEEFEKENLEIKERSLKLLKELEDKYLKE